MHNALFCEGNVFSFSTRIGSLEMKGRLHALRVEDCPITGQSTSLGATEYVDDFCVPFVGCWSVRAEKMATISGRVPGTENPQGPTASAESPKEAKKAREGVERVAPKVKETHGQAWAWTTLKKPFKKNNAKDAGGESSLGQEQEEKRWGLSPGCSEPRPLHRKLRIADEISTKLVEAALQNTQIDKAMAAMGIIAQNLKKKEKATVARGGGSKLVQA